MNVESWKAYHEREKAYYRNPTVQWFDAGDLELAAGGPLPKAGYYVLHSCGEPGCCRPSGPFSTQEEAREYSRVTLVAKEGERAKHRKETGRDQ